MPLPLWHARGRTFRLGAQGHGEITRCTPVTRTGDTTAFIFRAGEVLDWDTPKENTVGSAVVQLAPPGLDALDDSPNPVSSN